MLEEKLPIENIKKPDFPNTYLTRKEVCKLLQISLPTLNDWAKQEYIKSRKIGNKVLYKPQDIDSAVNFQYKFKRNL